ASKDQPTSDAGAQENEETEEAGERDEGIFIGRQPAPLHLRGWLARHSVRAMALFELLACERRALPFGHQPGDPYGSYSGYLTPEETTQLADCLHAIELPTSAVTKDNAAADASQRQPQR